MMSSGVSSVPKSSPKAGPGPADSAGFGQQRALESGEVAQTHKLCAFGDGLGDLLVGQVREDASEPVAATRNQGHVGATGGGPANGRDAGGVVTGKTHVTGQRRFIDFHLMAQLLQAFDAPAERRPLSRTALEGE